jgi:hypothetical protein
MSSDWTIPFRDILGKYQADFLAAKNSKSEQSRVAKKVRKKIEAAQTKLDEQVSLPSSLKKVLVGFSLEC